MAAVIVSGERCDVRPCVGHPGQYDFVWLSGPNEGYGFTSARSDGGEATREDLDRAILNFLAQINPVTGYIE